jgi:hypothetical protein
LRQEYIESIVSIELTQGGILDDKPTDIILEAEKLKQSMMKRASLQFHPVGNLFCHHSNKIISPGIKVL